MGTLGRSGQKCCHQSTAVLWNNTYEQGASELVRICKPVVRFETIFRTLSNIYDRDTFFGKIVIRISSVNVTKSAVSNRFGHIH